jgi:uncharacterized protein YyaL (SSP411 family)
MKTLNRLAAETSPYLRQHAENPVDWYPWGDEAFARARAEDKPVFLSIGYSACHWCHVMERESFADPEAAVLLNRAFVCVKVDREERPDIDQHFMAVCQALTGSGGWPLTIVMTPDGQPFFAATYIPKDRRFGRPGLTELVPRLGEAWATRRDEVLRAAASIRTIIADAAGRQEPAQEQLQEDILQLAADEFEADFDEEHGGFGGAPKFPSPHNLMFLLRFAKRTGNARSLHMVEGTLEAMRRGGIRDHLGGGFHRYATDSRWLVPHFEKMLYDQALLAMAYLEAYQATGRTEFARTAQDTLDYVLRDMSSAEGGFYAAEDADSEGEEGKFYLWTMDEISRALSPADADLAARAFGLKPEGNFQDPLHPGGRENILHEGAEVSSLASEFRLTNDQVERRLVDVRRRLFDVRAERTRPLRDTKVLADWNGLMIAALARATVATGESRFLATAKRAGDFIRHEMRDPGGRLLHVWAEGRAKVPAFLDDYAFLVWGLIELYEADFGADYLSDAVDFTETALDLFRDASNGGFFSTAAGTDLPLRHKEVYDGAAPSGNSVMLLNLLRLSRLTGRTDLETEADTLSRALGRAVSAQPRAHAFFLCGVDYALGPSSEIVIAGRKEAADTAALLQAVRSRFLPSAVTLFRPTDEEAPAITKVAPFTTAMKDIGGRAAAYVCSRGTCSRPVTSVGELERLLGKA